MTDDELVCDLLRDFDGQVLDIHVDDDSVEFQIDASVFCSDGDNDATTNDRAVDTSDVLGELLPTPLTAADLEPQPWNGDPCDAVLVPSNSNTTSDNRWMRLLLSSADVDVLVRELQTADNDSDEASVSSKAPALDYSFVDIAIDYDDDNGGRSNKDKDNSSDSIYYDVGLQQQQQQMQWIDELQLCTPTPALLRLAGAWTADCAGSLAEWNPRTALPPLSCESQRSVKRTTGKAHQTIFRSQRSSSSRRSSGCASPPADALPSSAHNPLLPLSICVPEQAAVTRALPPPVWRRARANRRIDFDEAIV